jgi:hypothetical protein
MGKMNGERRPHSDVSRSFVAAVVLDVLAPLDHLGDKEGRRLIFEMDQPSKNIHFFELGERDVNLAFFNAHWYTLFRWVRLLR